MFSKLLNPNTLSSATAFFCIAYLAISVASLLYKDIIADIFNFIVMLFS